MTVPSTRVLFCTLDYPPSAAGGAEKQAQLQAEGLLARGHHVEVVCPRVGGHRSGLVNGIRVHRLPRLPWWPLRPISYLLMLGVYLLVRLRAFQLVHVHLANLQADVAVAVAGLVGRASYLKLAAGGPLGEIGRMRRVSWLTRFHGIRHATMIQAISDEIADDLVELGVPPDRVVRIPNGVAIAPNANDGRAQARELLDLPLEGIVVLFVGRLEVEKGVEDLLAIWSELRAPAGSTLVLLGNQGIKHPADIRRLPKNVEHRTWSTDVGSFLSAADVFVLPSYAEGMSNALLEAMASGLVCVASRVGAAAEMITDGENGILIEAGDRNAIAAALAEIAADADRRARMGAAARAWVAEHYGIGEVVSRIEAAYRVALATK